MSTGEASCGFRITIRRYKNLQCRIAEAFSEMHGNATRTLGECDSVPMCAAHASGRWRSHLEDFGRISGLSPVQGH
eukprot:3836923-Heterocapsa_arctica.AAC.1